MSIKRGRKVVLLDFFLIWNVGLAECGGEIRSVWWFDINAETSGKQNTFLGNKRPFICLLIWSREHIIQFHNERIHSWTCGSLKPYISTGHTDTLAQRWLTAQETDINTETSKHDLKLNKRTAQAAAMKPVIKVLPTGFTIPEPYSTRFAPVMNDEYQKSASGGK